MSRHTTKQEAEAHVRERLEALDPDQTLAWAAIERLAVRHDPRATLAESYEAAEGADLERVVAQVRDNRLR